MTPEERFERIERTMERLENGKIRRDNALKNLATSLPFLPEVQSEIAAGRRREFNERAVELRRLIREMKRPPNPEA
jgi:hypothetical protein